MADGRELPPTGYWLRYLLASAAILGAVWAVVTRVLPPRLLPNADLREQAVRFSTEPPSYELSDAPVPSRRTAPEPGVGSTPERGGEPSTVGPRGRLWEQVGPLLETGRSAAALPHFRSYLETRPGDDAVRLEYARALVRAGRPDAAERQFRRLADSGDAAGRLGLARLLWGQNRLRAAAEQFRRVLETPPGDDGQEAARRSLAIILRTLGEYSEAARHFRYLVRRSDDSAAHRVELARTLYWQGRSREALAVLDAAGPEASSLKARIESGLALPAPSTVTASPLERARRARRDGDFRRAEILYQLATWLGAGGRQALLEWADFLATEAGEPGRAVGVLDRYGPGDDPAPAAVRRRIARYATWAGREDRARRVLEDLAAEGRANPGDLALLGDLLRWAEEPGRARTTYRTARATGDSAAARRATRGLDAIRERARGLASSRDPRRVELTGTGFSDSDGFGRIGRGAVVFPSAPSGLGRFVAAADWTRLDGARVPRSSEAAGIELGYLRWLDEATTRIELRAGREQRLSGSGGVSRLNAKLLLLDRIGDRIGIELSRRPAHELTQSLASLRRGQRATGVAISVAGPTARASNLTARLQAHALDAGGGSENVRLLGSGSWLTSTSGPSGNVRLGTEARLLGYTSAAFSVGDRAGYWSPEISWTQAVVADWRVRPDPSGWGAHARLQPGLSVVKERGRDDVTAGASLYAVAGLLRRWTDASAEARVSWIRSRAGRYDALAGTLRLTWRF